MSEPAAGVAARTPDGEHAQAGAWRVRVATATDSTDVAAGLRQLLRELGGTPPDAHALEDAARTLIEQPALGCVLLADTIDGLVGVLAASWQHAIHVPGRYGLIQDLWVDPHWRSAGVGAALIEALTGRARDEGIARIEVGLPSERFAALASTSAFYERTGFSLLGPRMRLVIS